MFLADGQGCRRARQHGIAGDMLNRRSLFVRVGAASLLAAGSAHAATSSFQDFLAGIATEARANGVSQAMLDRALGPIRPNDKVLELDRKQPEFTLTW
jgi:membrane-bound lytic murein transglycosylase B